MLPVPFQFIIAMIVYAINERTARRIDYLQEEVRVLKETLATATGKKRIDFSAEQRRRLALKGKALPPKNAALAARSCARPRFLRGSASWQPNSMTARKGVARGAHARR